LAGHLVNYQRVADLLVLGLPRGGVPVASMVAQRLGAPLDVLIVRKVGVPGHAELAMGAVASGGVVVRNGHVIDQLGISSGAFDEQAQQQQQEVRRREQLYRGHRTDFDIAGRTVILVDDGLATGASMQAAVEAVQQQSPKHVVVAVPVASRDTADAFRGMVDDFICVHETDALDGVGRWYEDFSQTSDEQVRQLLGQSAQRGPEEAGGR